jgi:type IV fimbrial biogenesis protein FimT
MTRHPILQRGFTLIELMITLVIAVIAITVGAPSLTEFVAAQRVRTTASDLVGDMALARAEAIKESRQAMLERLPGGTSTWKDGWRICVDINSNGTCDNAEVRKATTTVPGRSKVCSTTNDFNDRIIFRPDGRVVRTVAAAANDGLRVSDDNADSATENDRIRLIFIGISGRARMEVQDNDPANPTRGTACP